MPIKNCATCRFYAVEAHNVQQGNCHRNPPAAFVLMGPKGKPIHYAYFTVVKFADWCGEWNAKFDVEGTFKPPAVMPELSEEKQ